ncbi:dTDP-4-dehydrorhamnose 3,5-epimerase [Oceanicaulis sp. MMSF_3324]|uniref:dTDP-4-dehydrorhamnose 3,5-epimerase n=1 Tax=Oceanicaulis sp. MMSF_3324 TaxID=3046702 RepID=UPI00273E91A1|nr:dTDP-4-dehydrorhamnose 3,5-epimerase [Oceanicaulis sp. MMSF_3324]
MTFDTFPEFDLQSRPQTNGPLVVTPARFGDSRGWFSESYNRRRLAEAGFDVAFVQDNLSFSAHKGTLRGLHYQSPPHAQGKLVGVMTGAIRDVVVDIREGSKSYGRWAAVELSEDNGKQLWVPPGFLHGFVTLSDNTRVAYKVTDYYSKEHDGSVAWNDPDLGVDWGVDDPILSDKDAAAPRLKEVAPLFPAGWDGA